MEKNIQDRLKEYRIKKEKEEQRKIWSSKPLWERLLPFTQVGNTEESVSDVVDQSQKTNVPLEIEKNKLTTKLSDSAESIPHKRKVSKHLSKESNLQSMGTKKTEDTKYSSIINATIFLLKIMLWFILLILFIKLEFAAVFVVMTMFYIMFVNLRKEGRKPWEPSAYSVFNPNCEAIDGTLDPQQFEREIRHGIL